MEAMVSEMTRKDAIQHLQNVLRRRRDALRQALVGDLSLLNELRGQSSGDVADFALDAAQDEISSQLAEVESRELANIENALECMREGTYGACDICGESIPLARLQALPYATTCICCQRESERSGVRRGVPNWSRVDDFTTFESEVVLSDLEFDVT
jgi:DnaK suppressor protein